MLLLPQFIALAVAASPLYILNAPVEAPKNYKLAASDFAGVVAHFIGSSELASQGAVDAAQFVPGTFMDNRKSSAVVITEFDLDLGEAVMEVEDVQSPKETDVSTPLSGKDALAALRSLEDVDSQTLLISATGIESEVQDVLESLEAKVLVLGVQRGKAVPVFRASQAPAKQAEAAQGVEAVESAAESEARVSGPIPSTFKSLEHCQSQTSNCSGHGECVKAHDVWSCACKATTHNKYTTYWGGNACEKRDVSWQFNLLLWTAVGILVATVAGVSLLFSIDSQPLPGVLNVAT